jgi:hypothetical protein
MFAAAQMDVTVSPVKIVGQKAVVPLAIQNNFNEAVKSARAVAFLLDEHGRMLAQSTKWVIGGSTDKAGLKAGGTNSFNFVINITRPFTGTNTTAHVTFNHIILESGKLADPAKQVTILPVH